MGYTTAFTGEFSCYRPENDHIGSFLRAVRDGDAAAPAALADWLLDHGDARAEAVAALANGPAERRHVLWSHFGLRSTHAGYLRAFSRTRRMKRDPEKAKGLPDPVRQAAGLPLGEEAAYFVGGTGYAGQDRDGSVVDYNDPPAGQPGLWCKWVPNELGTGIVWDRGEKFYDYIAWLEYLLEHFLTPWGYVVNGRVAWKGEDRADTGVIIVTANAVEVPGGRRPRRS